MPPCFLLVRHIFLTVLGDSASVKGFRRTRIVSEMSWLLVYECASLFINLHYYRREMFQQKWRKAQILSMYECYMLILVLLQVEHVWWLFIACTFLFWVTSVSLWVSCSSNNCSKLGGLTSSNGAASLLSIHQLNWKERYVNCDISFCAFSHY